MTTRNVFAACIAVLAAVSFSEPRMGARVASVEVVATGLNNPRGLNFGPEGALYVAEAGSGGAGPCGAGPDNTGERCYGPSSSITRIDLRTGVATRVAVGLPSLAIPPAGSLAAGMNDISFNGRGNAMLSIGFGQDPAARIEHFGSAGLSFARLGRMVAAAIGRCTRISATMKLR